MARTPLLERLGSALSVAREAHVRNLPTDDVIDERRGRAGSRRAFLAKVGAGLAGAMAAPLPMAGASGGAGASPRARVAVVGAGLAGLTCAYRLRQAGVVASIFEANTRLGGRCWTRRDDFADGQIAEHGGELIDQGHTNIRQLVHELGLDLDNLLRSEDPRSVPCYHFGGSPYSHADATADLKTIWQKLHGDLSAARYPTLYNSSTPRGAELDRLSVVDWINETVPGGIGSPLGQLLNVAYNIEYGGECDEQSSLNLIYLLGYTGPGQLRIFGTSNEKYHVRGGNDQIAQRLAAPLAAQIETGAALVAVTRNSDGTFTLTLDRGHGTDARVFDKIVLAIPFSILGWSVDLRRAGFSPLKLTAIRDLGMGTNSKLNVQFRDRHWRSLKCNGETYSDRGYQATWEVSRGQAGPSGILVDYTGGRAGAGFGTGTPQKRAMEFLGRIEPVLPGLTSQWNGRATVDFWPGNSFTRGSYSFWKVGQYTRFAGVEGEQQGNCHFAGEHTSIDAQGYLEGAVESGGRAASEILDDLGRR